MQQLGAPHTPLIPTPITDSNLKSKSARDWGWKSSSHFKSMCAACVIGWILMASVSKAEILKGPPCVNSRLACALRVYRLHICGGVSLFADEAGRRRHSHHPSIGCSRVTSHCLNTSSLIRFLYQKLSHAGGAGGRSYTALGEPEQRASPEEGDAISGPTPLAPNICTQPWIFHHSGCQL